MEINLRDLLTEETIDLNANASDWEEAIRKSGSILVKNRMVKPEYVDEMISSVYKYGPYIVLMPGIALAHARDESMVYKDCISMITLVEPIKFGSKANDPVSVVFSFAVKNEENHSLFLCNLAKFLLNEENVNLIKGSDDKELLVESLKYIEYIEGKSL